MEKNLGARRWTPPTTSAVTATSSGRKISGAKVLNINFFEQKNVSFNAFD